MSTNVRPAYDISTCGTTGILCKGSSLGLWASTVIGRADPPRVKRRRDPAGSIGERSHHLLYSRTKRSWGIFLDLFGALCSLFMPPISVWKPYVSDLSSCASNKPPWTVRRPLVGGSDFELTRILARCVMTWLSLTLSCYLWLASLRSGRL